MNLEKKKKIIQRIEKQVGIPNLEKILADQITPSDVQSLLLSFYQQRAVQRTPNDILSDYKQNKYTNPSTINPLLFNKWDKIAFQCLPNNFEAIELSPVAPLGSVSRIAPINQDWILTTIRNIEVLSDATNVLALECTCRRLDFLKNKQTKNTSVNLASSHRVIRTQYFEGGPHLFQHFRLFSLCSAGNDIGNLGFEFESIKTHILFYLQAIKNFLGHDVSFRVVILDLSREPQNNDRINDFTKTLNGQLNGIEVHYEKINQKEGSYYQTIRFKIYIKQGEEKALELVDGGATDWTKKLMNNAKERLIISAIGSDRLCGLYSK
ncbi:MAG: hypothetical protein FK734_20120 [Asgard group archaeon]|nr:hypothetical protein [Asgard group archaeon]